MKKRQEPKYGFKQSRGDNERDTKLVNRATGETIPNDEPVFIFRARDCHAVDVLTHYARLCIDGPHEHTEAIHQRLEDFMAFRDANPDRMKTPD